MLGEEARGDGWRKGVAPKNLFNSVLDPVLFNSKMTAQVQLSTCATKDEVERKTGANVILQGKFSKKSPSTFNFQHLESHREKT